MDMASHSKKFFAGIACLLFVFSASMGFLGTQIYEGNYNFSEPESIMSADKPTKETAAGSLAGGIQCLCAAWAQLSAHCAAGR